MHVVPYRRFLSTVLFLGPLCLGVPAHLYAHSPASTVMQAQTHGAPPERFYPLMFRHMLYLQDSGAATIDAGAQASPSSDVTGIIDLTPTHIFTMFYATRVGATNTEAAAMLAEAQSWKTEIAPIDNQAHSLISQIRAKTPNGHMAQGEQPPAPPQELLALQQRHDAITLKHVQHLQSMIGADRFTLLDQAMHTQVRSGPATVAIQPQR